MGPGTSNTGRCRPGGVRESESSQSLWHNVAQINRARVGEARSDVATKAYHEFPRSSTATAWRDVSGCCRCFTVLALFVAVSLPCLCCACTESLRVFAACLP
jgi:hypothetical protein